MPSIQTASYKTAEEFDFLWQAEFEEKIYLYAVNDLDDTPVYEMIQRMETYLQGGAMIAPASLWHVFRAMLRSAMPELNRCGPVDDDQVVMLMTYRRCPDLLRVVSCPWCGVFFATNVEHFTLVLQEEPSNAIIKRLKRLRHTARRWRLCVRYAYEQFKTVYYKHTIID